MSAVTMGELKLQPVWLKCVPNDKGQFKKPAYAADDVLRGDNGTPEDRARLVTHALAAVNGNKVSFATLAGSGIVGIDIDHARDDDDEVKTSVLNLVKKLGGYAEFSPSGNIHVIMSGTPENTSNISLPDGATVAFYTATGHLTYTGNCVTGVDDETKFATFDNKVFAELRTTPNVKASRFNCNSPREVAKLKAALLLIDADDCNQGWRDVTYALGHSFNHNDEGQAIALAHAARSDKFNEKDTLKFYHEKQKSGRVPITVATVLKRAYELGFTWANPHNTDTGNAERLVDQHGSDFRYCYAKRKWIVWIGDRWIQDNGAYMMAFAKDTAKSIYADGVNVTDADVRKAIESHSRRTESRDRLKAMIELAQSESGVAIESHELDSNPWLLGVLNGVLDLRTGELRPAERSDLITKSTSVNYLPDAQCPKWLEFLDRIFEHDADLIAFVHRALGYSLTGDTSGRCMLVSVGSGANGKTVLREAIHHIMADYACEMEAEILMASKHVHGANAARGDIVRLDGIRFAGTSETEEGQRLSEAFVNKMTGGDTITARQMYVEQIEFPAQFKVWLSCNHKPEIRGTDDAIWDRIKLIPFNVRIPESEWNSGIEQQLRDEGSGILAWMMRGCLDWQRLGKLDPPKIVRDAVGKYRQEMNVIARWIEDQAMRDDPNTTTPCSECYEDFVKWSKAGGEFTMSQTKFGRRMIEAGFVRDDGQRPKVYRGIELRF